MSTDLEILDWLHDSELLAIDVTFEEGERRLVLLVRGDPEMGFEDWGGTLFRVELSEIDLLELQLTGFNTGPVQIDKFESVSVQRFRSALAPGQRRPRHAYAVCLIDGSEFKVACQGVQVRRVS